MKETSASIGGVQRHQESAISKKRIKVADKKSAFRSLLPVIVFFIVWELIARFNQQLSLFNPLFLPPLTMILSDGWELAKTGIIGDSVLHSTIRILVGFSLGSVAAVLLGVLISRSQMADNWISPILNLIGPVPALALLPIFIIWFGIGELPKILLIAWTTLIPVLLYTLDGLKSVNPTLIRSALSLGAKERQIFARVILPSAIPSILVGIQVSLGLSFSSLIVSEMMGAKSGLGYIIVDARNYFKISNMFVSIILIGLEYSIFAYLLKKVERRVISWRKGGVREAVEK
jgi:ABC-type nitrate/sulfonate/bicarbonate transport system permease component